MAKKQKVEEPQEEKKSILKKSKLPTKKYPLIQQVKISGEIRKKGELVDLTKEGYEYFKSQKYVK